MADVSLEFLIKRVLSLLENREKLDKELTSAIEHLASAATPPQAPWPGWRVRQRDSKYCPLEYFDYNGNQISHYPHGLSGDVRATSRPWAARCEGESLRFLGGRRCTYVTAEAAKEEIDRILDARGRTYHFGSE